MATRQISENRYEVDVDGGTFEVVQCRPDDALVYEDGTGYGRAQGGEWTFFPKGWQGDAYEAGYPTAAEAIGAAQNDGYFWELNNPSDPQDEF